MTAQNFPAFGQTLYLSQDRFTLRSRNKFCDSMVCQDDGNQKFIQDTCMPYPFPPCHKGDNHTAPAECSHAPFHTPKCVHKCNKNYTEGYQQDKHYGADLNVSLLVVAGSLMSYAIDNDEDAIRKELMTYGPIEVAFMVYTDFFHYKKGVYKVTLQVDAHHILPAFLLEDTLSSLSAGEKKRKLHIG
ncbi:unnamed protein product [Cylicostephanus goldi]|uniref:Peptidase C1A papain C-terminal domain-containing protein n=1 Tax=Cylicostephanus goldi TaxID=71465 RepID=A0A3P6TEW9_CYLGO|nr:unnamed protein product [Cylicostephanus goldi]